jgi:hypothetical protein
MKLLPKISAQRSPAEARREFAGRGSLNERRRTESDGGAKAWSSVREGGECEEDEEEGAVVFIKERESGQGTAGPRRFASRPATVRTLGRHVAKGYTRENGRHTEAHTGSRRGSGIRCGAFNACAGVDTM